MLLKHYSSCKERLSGKGSVGDRNCGRSSWQPGCHLLTTDHPHSHSSPGAKLNFQIYIKTRQALWDMISRCRRIADLQQPALNKMRKDLVSSQLPREGLWELRAEPRGRIRVQFTVCFSVGGKAAHILDAEGKYICGEHRWDFFTLAKIHPVSPLKREQPRVTSSPGCSRWPAGHSWVRPPRRRGAPASEKPVCSAGGCRKAHEIKQNQSPCCWPCGHSCCQAQGTGGNRSCRWAGSGHQLVPAARHGGVGGEQPPSPACSFWFTCDDSFLAVKVSRQDTRRCFQRNWC